MNALVRSVRVLSQLRELGTHDRWTRTQLIAHRDARLRRMREHAYARSPFYRALHRGLERAPLHELPVLTPALLMERFDDVVTDRAVRRDELLRFVEGPREELFLGRYWVTATSGGAGPTGLFVFDEDEWVQLIASFARGKELSGSSISLRRRTRHASVASIGPWHGSTQVARSVKSWWTPVMRLAASEPLPEIVRRLNDWQPEVLITHASTASSLAAEQLARRLHIRPERVFTSFGRPTRETRRLVEQAWGDEPFDQIAAAETAGIAAECLEGRRKHLFEDLVIVEVVDDDYRPVPDGAVGSRLLATPLFGRTQPLIRYEITDSIGLRPAARRFAPCACGRPYAVLEDVGGG